MAFAEYVSGISPTRARYLVYARQVGNLIGKKEDKIMPVSDPVADMLTRIRNALIVKRESVEMPSSKMKLAVAQILQKEGYIKNFDVAENQVGSTLKITLKYGPDGTSVISGLRKISKPGLRIYARKEEVPMVLNGLGIAIISTSKGLITDAEARKNNVGGEVIAYVW